ncbi:hypothetical protein BV511_06515 [Methylorubrum extorquens]|uniref:hypothetical protein n=1 Tax=Methylorubrum extorquens TaxID=408 RepID=UPI000972BD10|nr:hypothetical protein [Methylorubrum extorquens]APX84402.1 hypothetical protein BV511_06515 [Methylorubrum extorquens]
MPNYATTRLTLAGPQSELDRFVSECVRVQRDDPKGLPALDLDALVPMPPEILATIDNASDEAQQVALAATGHKDWYYWSRASWGTKWNTSAFDGGVIDGMIYDCMFDTAWACPQPALTALAARYPALRGTVVASEQDNDWCLFGAIQDGSYTSATSEFDPQIHLLLRGRFQQGRFPSNSAHALIEGLADARAELETSDASSMSRCAGAIFAALNRRQPSSLIQRLGLERATLDVVRLLDSGVTVLDIRESGLEGAADTAFLLANDRSRTPLDRNLLIAAAAQLRDEALAGYDDEPSPCYFREWIEGWVLPDHDENELWAWAALAMYRPGVLIDMSDVEALKLSVLDYAERLYVQLAAYLSNGRPEQGVSVPSLGRAAA